ncbi:MAG: DUF485 domain-containing protein [Rhodospirillales bacterium]|nr:DUF485 domain-containing protein [Rhodospirillales bacterium]MCB9965680.1 DUF485 domain-containing protein [Rhodospirillales bacterium]
MIEKKLDELQHLSEYRDLVATRRRIIWPLAILMLLVYYAYILVIAFKPELFAAKIGEGHTTFGIVIGLGLIFFSFLLTGIYVHKANTKLEPLTKKLLEKTGDL